MSVTKKLLEASGGGGDPAYVDDVFQTTLTEGLGNETIVNGMDLADKGALIWQKSRIQASSHYLYDSERGAGKALSSNNDAAEQDFGSSGVQSWNSDGWTAGSGGPSSGNTTAQWVFAKQKGFFDIVTYTGDGVAGREIPHNLGSEPGMIIVKQTSSSRDWVVYHRSLGAGKYFYLNKTDATVTSTGAWNNVEPTSSVFTVGSGALNNANTGEYVAYVFAHDALEFGPNGNKSIIKCGSYTGTSNTDGPEIDLGWEPQFLLIKKSSGTENWIMLDTMRGIPTGGNFSRLNPNLVSTEQSNIPGLEVTPTGFKLTGPFAEVNDNGDYIYMAIRRPNKPAEEFEPDELFDTVVTNTSANPDFAADFPVDMAWLKTPAGNSTSEGLSSRLTGANFLRPYGSQALAANFYMQYDYSKGFGDSTIANMQAWMFRRAPGFFDVVTYEGNGVNGREVPHNLAAVPEMLWLKRTSDTSDWTVWSKSLDLDRCLYLNTNLANQPQSAFNDTAPTAVVFTVETDTSCNAAGSDYIAYLFASVPGICDIGSYTGTGNALNVDCGFTNGARFILIKRTDSTGDWYYWDTLRGIVAGNDPYLLLNSSAAQVTTTDYIDPLSSGFTVTATAPAALNNNGGTYIYMAIA